MLALFSLKNRTRYDINKQKEYFEAHPEMKVKIGVKDIELLILENLINATTEDSISYSFCKIMICIVKEGNLLSCDRPFLFEVQNGFSFLALSPYHLISFQKCIEQTTYTYIDAPPSLVEKYNEGIARNARDWIIATNKEMFNKYLPILKANDENDIPRFQEMQFLIKGCSIE